MREKRSKSIPGKAANVVIFLAVFVYGVGIGKYHWPPHDQLLWTKRYVADFMTGDQQIQRTESMADFLDSAFSDELIDQELLYSPIRSVERIQEANNEILIQADQYEDAYKDLVLKNTEFLKFDGGRTTLLNVEFLLGDKQLSAYAYGDPGYKCGEGNVAAMVIPGSGNNHSSEIYNRYPGNYHYGIMNTLDKTGGDNFVFIKPNEDVLAFHNGINKLSTKFLINYHLNREGSYSASYLIHSLAIMKYLKSCYATSIIAGLSQGGAAALLNSLQSHPDLAIVSSGYSVMNHQVENSGHDQIILPDSTLARSQNPRYIRNFIQASPTHFFFSWGEQESGLYGIEAEEGITCDEIGDLKNVSCVIHEGGHEFPFEEISAFIGSKLD